MDTFLRRNSFFYIDKGGIIIRTSKKVRKSLAVGIISLFVSAALVPLCNAENSTHIISLKSSMGIPQDPPKGYNPHMYALWRIRGTVTNLTVWDTVIHFNTTHVVESGIGLFFLLPFVPLPFIKRDVSANEEWWVIWDGPFIVHNEIITENYVDLFAILWGEWYSEPNFIHTI